MGPPLRLDLLLVGFGNVGRRFARLMEERRERLLRDEGLALRTVGIFTRRHGGVFDTDGIAADRVADASDAGGSLATAGVSLRPGWCAPAPSPPGEPGPDLSVAFIDQAVRTALAHEPSRHLVVVETTVLDIASGQPAIDHVRAALERGAHVVTANKGPVAFAWRELAALAKARNRSFLFEGAVMDGIPIFNLARETLPGVSVVGFRGVVNSTTNHILSAMEGGREFGEALAEMEAAGITEADPSLDVDGWDAAAKTAALANVLMDAGITPHAVARRGIRDLAGADVRAAMARGRRWKLVSSARLAGGGVVATVAPQELPAADVLGGLNGQQNALILTTDLLGEMAIVQLDAGLTATAYALVGDLGTIARRLRR